MRVFMLKSCDTCRRALHELRAAGYAPETVDLRAAGIPGAEIERFLEVFGEALINRRSTTWRGLDAGTRGREPRQLLADFPVLMKRPLIEHEGRLYLGWGAETRTALLGPDAG